MNYIVNVGMRTNFLVRIDAMESRVFFYLKRTTDACLDICGRRVQSVFRKIRHRDELNVFCCVHGILNGAAAAPASSDETNFHGLCFRLLGVDSTERSHSSGE